MPNWPSSSLAVLVNAVSWFDVSPSHHASASLASPDRQFQGKPTSPGEFRLHVACSGGRGDNVLVAGSVERDRDFCNPLSEWRIAEEEQNFAMAAARFDGSPPRFGRIGMSLRALAVPAAIPGQIWLASMPGRYESWPAFISQAKEAGLSLVVCLTPRHEMLSHSPAYAEAVARGNLPFEWMNMTMRDFGLASDASTFENGIDRIAQAVRDGQHVMLHCAAGIGRTGTAATCVLKRLGVSREAAIEAVRAAGSSPESALQSGLIDRFRGT